MGTGNSPGLDGIPAELVKATGPAGIKRCVSIWESCHWPEGWKIQEFVVSFKAGDRKQCSNYRTIALFSHTSKVLLLIIEYRLNRKLKFEQPEELASSVQERKMHQRHASVFSSFDGENNCHRWKGFYHVHRLLKGFRFGEPLQTV